MEKNYAENILSQLKNDFYIEEQVYGSHFSGARLRIDAILKPKNNLIWKNPNVSFGIEFKLEEKLKDTKDKTLWIKQCIDYANTNWDNYGYIYVFSCPSIFETLEYTFQDKSWLWNRILSNLGVGRIENHNYHGLTFYLQDTHRIWSKNGGVASGKHWTLKRKFGRDSFKYL